MARLHNTCGIYTITNKINGKIYVGYSKTVESRGKTHFWSLRNQNHENEYLQATYNKYGLEVFEFELLVECEEEFLLSEEHYWATLLNVHDPRFGYNIQPTHPYHVHLWSHRYRDKMYNHGNHHRVIKRIYRYSLNGKLEEEIPDFYQYCRKNGYSSKNIEKMIQGIIHTSYNSLWSFEKVDFMNPVIKRKHRSNLVLPIYQYSLNGELLGEFERGRIAAKILNLEYTKICSCTKNKRGSHGGFLFYRDKLTQEEVLNRKLEWALLRNKKTLLQFDLDGNLIKHWFSCVEVVNELGFPYTKWKVERAAKGEKELNGYIWKYKIKEK